MASKIAAAGRSVEYALILLCLRRAQLGACIAHDLRGRMQEEKGDAARHQKIGPGADRPADQYGRDDDGDIRDRIVSAEQPDVPNIGIAVPKSRENQRRGNVHGQGDYAARTEKTTSELQ